MCEAVLLSIGPVVAPCRMGRCQSSRRSAPRALAALLLLMSFVAPACAAVVAQQVDLTAGGSVVDGVLSLNEYGPNNSYSFAGGGTGLGGVLNGTNRVYFNSNVASLFIALAPGAALEHVVVLYLDTRDGGFTDATLSDDSAPDRRVVTELGAAGDDGFPFEADFALAISSAGCTLYELAAGALSVVPITAVCAAEPDASLREVSVPLAALGITHGGRAVDFFAAYCRLDLFNSNETVPPMPVINDGPNPGTEATVNYADVGRFITYNGNPRLVISQIYGGGGSTAALLSTDFVELYNPGPGYVNMANWSVQNASASGVAWQVTSISGFVPPGGYYLVTYAESGQGVSLGVLNDRSTPTGLPIADGKLALCNTITALSGNPPCPFPASVIDFVGYGVANTREPCTGTGADNAPAGTNVLSLQRRGCGGQDTDRNSADWTLGFPSPRNSQSPPTRGLAFTGGVSPHVARPGDRVLLQVAPRVCATDALPSGALEVAVNLTSLGGPAQHALRDDGTDGDERAGDGIYSTAVTIGPVAAGSRWLPVTLSSGALSGGGYLGVRVLSTTAPANDNCHAAQVIAPPYDPPVDVPGNLTNGAPEYNAVVALDSPPVSGMGSRRGQWFAVTGNGNTLTATLCPTAPAFDSVMIVLCGDCEGLSVVASADDVTPAQCPLTAQAAVRWCTRPDVTYFIWLATFSVSAPTQTFTLRISDDGAACSGARECDTCELPFGAALREAEPAWGPGRNDGCDAPDGRFFDLSAGDLPGEVCGSSFGFGDSVDADWFRFQAPESGLLAATLTAQFSGRVSLWRLGPGGSCAGRVLQATSASTPRCGSALLTGALTLGEWYALRVVPEPSPTQIGGVAPGATSSRYCLAVQIGAPPPNDACADALPLILGAPAQAGTTRGATFSASSSCDPIGRDVWYRLVTTQPGRLRIDTCGTSLDSALTVFAGDCDALIELACAVDCPGTPCSGPPACLTTPSLPAGDYFVRVSDREEPEGGAFQIRATFALDNDLCADALELPVNSVTTGTTVSATPDGGLPACAGPVGPGGGGAFSYTAGSVWYRLAPPAPGVVTVDTLTSPAGGGYDTRLTVFSGNCTELTCITANDDIEPLTRRSKVAFAAEPGREYFILVHGFGSATGNFVLTTTLDPQPENDECAQAAILDGESGSRAGTTRGATSPNFPPSAFPSCGTPYGHFDVWYLFSADCDGILALDTCGVYDTLVSVHGACPTALSAGQLTPLSASCNRDGPAGCAPGSALSVAIAGPQSVWIRVAGQDGAAPGDSFTLRYTFSPTAAAAPDALTADRPIVCPADVGQVVLSASGGSGTTLAWLRDDCETGARLGFGPILIVPAPAFPTTYFARWESSCGNSDCASLTITISDVIRGDSDGNGMIDFNDIGCFVGALIEPAAWLECGTLHDAVQYLCANDANGDGRVNFDDISTFVTCLVDGACP